MSVQYQGVGWNPQKKIYDRILWSGILGFNLLFIGGQLIFFPKITAETLILRTTSLTAVLLLHFILYIGPLCRINPRFLPLLYNRRHAGVAMFCFALIHGALATVHFHALGDTHPLISIFLANLNYNQLHHFPFQVLGFYALMIFMVMALTSHDFWLKSLGAKNWKRLHRLVYLAYALVIGHVVLGIFQAESHPIYAGLIAASILTWVTLHLLAFYKNQKKGILIKKGTQQLSEDGYVKICRVFEIPEKRARKVILGKEPIAIFRYDGKISAVHGHCRHQGGPLAEGKIIDGCITCPWHGYQYLPHNGQSPPPFTEKIKTYQVKILDEMIWLQPKSAGSGIYVEPTVY